MYLDSSDEASYDGGPTTNYFVPTEGSFPVNGTGTFQRLRSGSYGGYIIKPTDVVYRYELGTLGCHYHGVDVPVPSVFPTGSTVQFSFDYYISTGTVIETDYIANYEQGASGAITNGGQPLGVWRSVVLTSTVSLVGYPYVRAFLYPGACGSVRLAADGFILYKNPQLEMLNYASRFVYGPNNTNNVRSNGNVWRDLSGRGNDFTIQGNITWNKDTGFSNFDGNSVANGNKIFRSNFPQNLKTSQLGQGYTVVVVEDASLATRPGNTFFVAVNGDDTNVGDHPQGPFRTIAHALAVADGSTAGPVTIHIYPGEYEETTPLIVPQNTTITGEDLRNTIISPTTASQGEDIFHLNQNTLVENVTIRNFTFDSGSNTGYAFRFASGAIINERSPYVRNVSVITNNDAGIAGHGAWIDGSELNSASTQASMLFHSATFITPGVDCITMTNGVRVEWLNSFTYFANRGLYALQGSAGFANLGSVFGAEIRSIVWFRTIIIC